MMKTKLLIIPIVASAIFLYSCKKSFLDKKPKSELVNPQTVKDYQMLLDGPSVYNASPGLSLLGADEFYISDYNSWQLIREWQRNSTTWQANIFDNELTTDEWNFPYKQILQSNIILEGLENVKVADNETEQARNIKGGAYFSRAYAYFNLYLLYCKAYDKTTSATDLGLPIRLRSGVDELVQRANAEETINFILDDLLKAKDLLPATVYSLYRNRPSRPAAHAMLSRVYHYMSEYEQSEKYADSLLATNSQLYDYKTIDTLSSIPFDKNGVEALYYSVQIPNNFNTVSNGIQGTIDTSLYRSYFSGDRRRPIFFRLASGRYYMKRGYGGNTVAAFSGLAVDEVLLNKAECLARKGQTTESLTLLNALLIKRFDNSFAPLTASTSAQALDLVLAERKKELIWRGIRWLDLKRLNKEGRNITLHRTINGQVYTLEPNSPRYVYPIPPDEIRLSGIQQNIR